MGDMTLRAIGLTVLEGCMKVGLRRFRVGSALCTSRTRAPRISSRRAKDVLLLGHQKSIESYTRFFSYFQFEKTVQVPLLAHLVPVSRHILLINPGFHLIYSDVISTLFLSMILSDSIRRPLFHLFAFISAHELWYLQKAT